MKQRHIIYINSIWQHKKNKHLFVVTLIGGKPNKITAVSKVSAFHGSLKDFLKAFKEVEQKNNK